MNALAEKYGDKLAILAFPCNQFGHQTNEGNEEFLNTLKYVRAGDGFEPAESDHGVREDRRQRRHRRPLFKWLKSEMMIPSGEMEDTGSGCADIDALVLPRGGFGGSTVVLWTPVARSDIAWNFEKFLVGPDGAPVKRYSRYFDTNEIASDIDALL